MAERVTRQLIDDIDGTDITEGGGETIEFAIRGVTYRIDLSLRNVSRFDKALSPFVEAAVRASGDEKPRTHRSSRRQSSKPKPKTDSSAVRAWATDNGYTVSPRGRVPGEVLDAFEEAEALGFAVGS